MFFSSLRAVCAVTATTSILAASAALAQSDTPDAQSAPEGACVNEAGEVVPPAQIAQAQDGAEPGAGAAEGQGDGQGDGQDGTDSGDSGSTGWTGGTGGSRIGTDSQDATAGSKTWHAPTARGLDLKQMPDRTDEPDRQPGPAEHNLADLPDC